MGLVRWARNHAAVRARLAGSVELRPFMTGAAEQEELGARACPAQRVVQRFTLGRCDNVVEVAVRDQEGGRRPASNANGSRRASVSVRDPEASRSH